MSIIVTGGAGFIGSCLVRTLNDMGIEDIIIVDNINTSEKWLNLQGKRYMAYYHKNHFRDKLPSLKDVTCILHMGACSSTTEEDFDYLYDNNFLFSTILWEYAVKKNVSFIYASSAATYGAGEKGFSDSSDIKELKPLNRYGYVKQLFDLWAEKQKEHPAQYVGLKFFNVYGPNEYHKGTMASMVYHGFNQINQIGKIKLFKSYKDGVGDGEQLRDFVYVKDVCKAIVFFMEHSDISGLYNIGTGKARNFNDLAFALYKSMGMEPCIEYIDMPRKLVNRYQYFTQADITKITNIGLDCLFSSLEEGVFDYVNYYLRQNYKHY